jgi:hypothetical protein
MPGHVHLFIGEPPTESPTGIVKILKGTTGALMFREHPNLLRESRHGLLWSPSQYVGTVGHVPARPSRGTPVTRSSEWSEGRNVGASLRGGLPLPNKLGGRRPAELMNFPADRSREPDR